jgi:hypothetical protein
MRLIPHEYQEIEAICSDLNKTKARCILVCSLAGASGVTTICQSVAERFKAKHNRVLIMDLNPISEDKVSLLDAEPWCFSDISCQLNIVEGDGIDYLSMSNLKDLEPAKNQQVLADAIERLKQEYSHIILDMSPVLKVNRGNIPFQSLSTCVDTCFLVVALGKDDEEALCNGQKQLEESGISNIKLLVNQNHQPPLGGLLLNAIEDKLINYPNLAATLKSMIRKQRWLFHAH